MSTPTLSSETHLDKVFGLEKRSDSFDNVRITVANPDSIRSWSHGEVKNPETINYRTFKPEKGGLFCERIFGPTKDWECVCGKYKRIKHKGIVCDRCGVEVTLSRVRRERMGHIELAVPVSHIWFYKCMPSRLGLALDMTARQLERVIYYEDYIVINPGDTPLEKNQLLTEIEFYDAQEEYGEGSFEAGMGAESLYTILSTLDLEALITELLESIEKTKSKQVMQKLSKRLKLAQGFFYSKTRPEWMILKALPVIPPDLRPLVPLEGGRFATSDLNDLYRRVINRNNRLRNLLQLRTPDVIIRNEKRMLQEAVDSLFDNGRHGKVVTASGNRPLKSLSDVLKGKGGRFRQNLLGKRVDYSGRSVIVVGPDLKLNQCGIPKTMALVLFEPFIIRKLKDLGYVHTVRSAKKLIERKTSEVWDILEDVTKEHPVLLNRAPTLHRLSIQAFEPVLIEGSAIRVHPLVCTAYNADFDGDQMAVHVPLSVEAQMEAKLLMLATNNIFTPSSGKPITTPSQDITLGVYFLTYSRSVPYKDTKSIHTLSLFGDLDEVEFAVASKSVSIHDPIRLLNPDYKKEKRIFGNKEDKIIITTPGRVRFNEIWPDELGFFNASADKKSLSDLIWNCYQVVGQRATVKSLDALKSLGFKEATRSGTSVGIFDMIIPAEKSKEIFHANAEVEKTNNQYRSGIITNKERYNKIVDIWTHAGDEITKSLFRAIEHNAGSKLPSPLFMMVDSGARGNRQQIKQLSGMRGLMAKPSGEIIERPIISNFRSGLSVLEYFISTHGARKGLADTALKTADSGYMTRKLVDVAQDVIITEEDCGTVNGIIIKSIYEGDEEVVDLKTRIYGRVSAEKVVNGDEIVVEPGQIIDEETALKLYNIGHEQLKIRSVLTCESRRGCCVQCYGINLSNNRKAKKGEAVGIIAAQSIGEPGTQLTMRTFHVGGVASGTFKQPIIKVKSKGIVSYNNLKFVKTSDNNFVALNKNGSIVISDKTGLELESYNIVSGSVINFEDNSEIKKGEILAMWDPYSIPIITEKSGKIAFKDMIQGITLDIEIDKETNTKGLVVIEHKEDLHPQIIVLDPKTEEEIATYSIPTGAHVTVKEGQKIKGGDQLAKTPRKVSETKDITGGLPRVAELFEARKPKEISEIAKIDGEVSFGGTIRSKRKLTITNTDTGEEEEHLIPLGKNYLVQPGDLVKKGQKLTDGSVVPHDILEVLGSHALMEHLVGEVQDVYRVQGVEINDKHIEIIIRQMLRKIKITDPGDTNFLWGDRIERENFEAINNDIIEQGGKPAEGEAILLGITKASLETDSFISAASFQDTTRVLTESSTYGKIDYLNGFKENVIMGNLIPSGTGFKSVRNIKVKELVEPLNVFEQEEVIEEQNNFSQETI